MAKKRNKHSSNYTNQKYIKWIGIIAEILAIISCVISYKNWNVIVTTVLVTITILLTLALLIYFIKKSIRLEKELQKEQNENKKQRKEKCKNCKTVYTITADESISFDKNFDKYALPFPYYEGDDDEYMVDYNRIYRLDNYLFVSFHDEDSEGKCYLTQTLPMD